MRAIDLHVHLPTEEWLAGAIGPNLAATEAYFRTAPERKTIEQVAEEYAERDILGVVLDWDEHRADAADRVVEAADLGLAGLKFHPTMQAFDPADERFYPIWGKAEELGLVALFHTGTCGIGAGTPGAGGTKIRYSHPGFLDAVGADFPGLTLLAAHFGWPWFLECLAIALHKANVWIELSGWAPKYLPPEVVREAGRRLNGRTVFGSDYPFISLDRWFAEAEALPWTEEARRAILVENAARLLGVGAGA